MLTSDSSVEDTIDLPAAPAIPGLRCRRFRGAADYAPMVAVVNAAKAADGSSERMTVEEQAARYSDLKNCDPAQDMLMVEIDGALVAYSRVTWWDEAAAPDAAADSPGAPPRIYYHLQRVDPAWRDQGIEAALLNWAEARLRASAAEHPPGVARLFETEAESAQVAWEALLHAAGYTPARYFYEMVRPDLEAIPDLPLPPGLEVRPVQPEHYRAIWEAENEALLDHWGFETPEEADFARWADPRATSFQPQLWQVAWDGDQVAGMIRNYINHETNAALQIRRGYTEFISTRRPWRRRGLARALLARSLRVLRDQGMTEAALGVDTENPSGALGLYESMGFRPTHRDATYRKPFDAGT